jgi:hypothetical protein
METMTRARALAISESVFRAGTRHGQRQVATRFARDVFKAIEAGDCPSPKYCADLAWKTWRRAWAK